MFFLNCTQWVFACKQPSSYSLTHWTCIICINHYRLSFIKSMYVCASSEIKYSYSYSYSYTAEYCYCIYRWILLYTTEYCYIPLHTVIYRCILLYTAEYCYIPLKTVIYRWTLLYTAEYCYIPLNTVIHRYLATESENPRRVSMVQVRGQVTFWIVKLVESLITIIGLGLFSLLYLKMLL